jgi:16S rRNA (guanine527-N7)-methyltransferase
VTLLPRWFLEARLPGIGRLPGDAEASRLDKYLKLLVKWQKTHRFVGSIEPAWLVENVLLDSLCFLEAVHEEARAVADLGSGAGVPGVPIAIVRPDLTLTLIEARQRRASFLSTVVRELELRHVRVFAGRAEEFETTDASRFDAVVMRCAGRIESVLGIARRLLRPAGVVIVSATPSGIPHGGAEVITVRTPSGTLRTLHRYR